MLAAGAARATAGHVWWTYVEYSSGCELLGEEFPLAVERCMGYAAEQWIGCFEREAGDRSKRRLLVQLREMRAPDEVRELVRLEQDAEVVRKVEFPLGFDRCPREWVSSKQASVLCAGGRRFGQVFTGVGEPILSVETHVENSMCVEGPGRTSGTLC
jgi:hypothetical protein